MSPSVVKVDAANGVGGASVRKVMGGVREEWLEVELSNDGSGVLNDQVRLGDAGERGVKDVW